MRNAKLGDVISGGAFVGDFFPGVSQGLAPDATLWSFEPNPVNYSAAKKTIEINKLHNVVLFPCAVGREESTAQLQIKDAKSTEPKAAMARIDPNRKISGDGFLEVEVKTLDSLVPTGRHVSLIQLDVEGFEGPALMGARSIIERCHPIFILEGRGIKAKWLNEKFRGCSYVDAGFYEMNQFFVSL
ncbi:FkbM family methyltransferase [Defluviimonas sp. SAOS-178_SWC]|uniref:FkbM family methyltransferase n=1 Tax=Defluviimonas sp. SAOS-178_SWC TaxID=3121287 RepID=UPI0032216C4D